MAHELAKIERQIVSLRVGNQTRLASQDAKLEKGETSKIVAAKGGVSEASYKRAIIRKSD